MRPDKDFKDEFNQEFANGNYVTKKIGGKVGIIILIVVIVATVGGFGLKMFNTNADRVVFKQSITYNEGVTDDLAKYKLEMIRSDDDVEKNAIAEMVNSRFANYDESKIENYDLREFLQNCRNLRLEEY